MAHHLRVKNIPHINKDGSPSATKHDYEVWDRSRGKRTLVGVAKTKKAVQELMDEFWTERNFRHASQHRHDHVFLNKHARRVK